MTHAHNCRCENEYDSSVCPKSENSKITFLLYMEKGLKGDRVSNDCAYQLGWESIKGRYRENITFC